VGGADSSPTLVLGDLCCTCQGVTTALSHTRITHTPPTHSVEAPASFCCSSPKGGGPRAGTHTAQAWVCTSQEGVSTTPSPQTVPLDQPPFQGVRDSTQETSHPPVDAGPAGGLACPPGCSLGDPPCPSKASSSASGAHGTGSVWDSSLSVGTKGPSSQGLKPPTGEGSLLLAPRL